MSNWKNNKIKPILSENRCVRILDSMAEGFQIINPDWRYLYVNEAAARHGNQTKEKLLGAKMTDVYPELESTEVYKVLRQCMDYRESHSIENEFTYPDGSKRWFNLNIQPDQEGLFITSTDITERKRQEKALRHNKTILDATGRMAKVGGWELNTDTMEVTWTEETYRIHEVLFDQQPSLLEAINFFHPEDRPKLEQAIQHAINFGEPYDMEIRFITAKEKHLWTRTICQPEIFNGKVIKLMGTFQDITDQKQVEEALEESKAFLDNMSDIAYIADDQGNLVWVNSAVKRITGFSPEEIIGKPFLPLFIEENQSSLIDVYQRTLNGEVLENILTFKTGITCHFNSLPKRNKQGDITGTFGVARDISKRQAAEQALQTSEARLKRAQKIAKVGNWEYDIATGKVWGSEEAFRLYGIERTTEFLPLDVVQSCNTEAIRVNQALEDLIGQNKAYDIEFQIKPKKRKNLIHVHSTAELVYDGEGKPEKVVGVIQDITESKQAEEILHKSHEMLKRTEAMANIGSWEWDVQHDRTYWSEELFRIFGLAPVEDAPPFTEQSGFYANGDIQRLRDAVENCVTHGVPYEIELRAIRPDGEIRYCVSKGQPQYDENGNVFRLAGSFQDITDRKHSENHIRSLERRNQALLDHSPVCHKIVDLEFNLKYMSANGFKMLNLDRNSDVYGKPYPFNFFPEAFQNEMKKKLKEVMDTGEMVTLEALTNDFHGNGVWLDSSLIPVFNDDHHIEYLTVVSADVSQRKRDEKEKTGLEGQLRQAQKMEAVGRLAGGVAHDFNNMLNVILGYTEMAMEDVPANQPISERLQEIKKAGQRSADLTRQLLAFARKQTISPKVIDLNKTLGDMTTMLSRLIGEDIDLAWRPGELVWPVKMDPSQIDQILANLCVNARDAIADVGKVTIETGSTTFDETYCNDHSGFYPGEYVLLAVSDDGCGMDSEILDNIFEPFFTTKESGRGTGLGLATVYGVVKQNNGFINVYSEPGQGTTFKIYLPRYLTKAEVIPDKVKNLSTKSGHETILLVEDENAILRMTAQMLQRLGYQVITAATPGEAIRLSREHPGHIHLLVTDVVMPEMNGRDLAKNILSIYPNLKRLFMSGYTANVIAHHGILDEDVHFIQKPFSREQLGIKLREVLEDDEV